MGTWEGLGLPAYGEFYHYANSTGPQNVYVEADGVTNWTIVNPGTDNSVALTITDSSTGFSSGYMQGYYVSMTTSSAGTYSSANAQITGIGVDMFLSATTLACEAQGLYVYIAGSTISTGTSAKIAGLHVYIDDLKISAPAVKAGLWIHNADSSTTSAAYTDSFIFLKSESGSAIQSAVGFQAASNTEPKYLLSTNFAGNRMVQSINCVTDGTSDKVLVCNINGSTYWIPLYAASA